jgi:3-oxoadipate enol-lactonase
MKCEIDGAMIHVLDSGTPTGRGADAERIPPLVFIHGFPFSHAMWHHQLAAVSPYYRTVAYDVRGLGGSSAGDGVFTIEGHVDDLMTLLDHLEIRKAVVIGLSMGGYITLRALERNPERFAAAVLCDTRSESDSSETRLNRARSVAYVKRKGSAAFAEDFVKKVFAPDSFQRAPAEVEIIREIITRTPPLNIAAMLLALASRTDTTESLAAIAVPTLILVGEHDTTTPPEASQAMHARIKGSEIHIIPDAAHMSPMENPAEVNRHLMAFLKALE